MATKYAASAPVADAAWEDVAMIDAILSGLLLECESHASAAGDVLSNRITIRVGYDNEAEFLEQKPIRLLCVEVSSL